MDKKKDTPAEVETVTVTMSRPVAEAVQAACEMYLRLHMGHIEELDGAPVVEVPEWRRASEIPAGGNDEWNWVFIVGKDAKKAYTTTAAAQYDAKEDCWVTDLLTEFKKVDGHYLTKDLGYEVTHWMPLPEPPERGKDA